MTAVKSYLRDNPDLQAHADLIVRPPDWDEAVEWFPELQLAPELADIGMQYVGRTPMTRLALYVISRRRANTHAFALCCASQKFPGANTEDTFWGGRKHFAEVYGEGYYRDVKQKLAAQGVTLTAHQEYLPELAQYRGDPAAVVGHDRGRSYIKQRCEELGLACEGAVTATARTPKSDPLAAENCVPLAPDLIQRNFERFKKEKPAEAAKMTKREIKEAMVDKHGLKL